MYDFHSGILHVVLDAPESVNLPLIGKSAASFQRHHHDPAELSREPMWMAFNDFLPILAAHSPAAGVCCTLVDAPMYAPVLATKILCSYLGQWGHVNAHTRPSQQLAMSKLLVSCRAMLGPRVHKGHHTPPHDSNFCLGSTKVADMMVNMLHAMKLPYIIWFGLFWFITLGIMEPLVLLCTESGLPFRFNASSPRW